MYSGSLRGMYPKKSAIAVLEVRKGDMRRIREEEIRALRLHEHLQYPSVKKRERERL